MPTGGRNARHGPAVGLKAQRRNPGHRRNLVNPSACGIDQKPPLEHPRRRGHRPTCRRLGNGRDAGMGDNLTPIAPRLTGKVLQQQIRVDIPGMVAKSRLNNAVIQDRHHRAGRVHADRLQRHIGGLFGQLRRLTRPRQDHQPAL